MNKLTFIKIAVLLTIVFATIMCNAKTYTEVKDYGSWNNSFHLETYDHDGYIKLKMQEQEKAEKRAFIIASAIVIGFITKIIIFGRVCEIMAQHRGRNNTFWFWIGGIFDFTAMWILFCLGETDEYHEYRIEKEANLYYKTFNWEQILKEKELNKNNN